MDDRIELTEYIENIRQQFQGLMDNSRGDVMSLDVSPIEVNVSTVTSKDEDGRLRTYVISDKASVGPNLVQILKFTVTIGENNSAFGSNYSTPEARPPVDSQYGQSGYPNNYDVYPEVGGYWPDNDRHNRPNNSYHRPGEYPSYGTKYPDYSQPNQDGDYNSGWSGYSN